MEYHALYVIFEKEANFEFVVCCKLYVTLYRLILDDRAYRLGCLCIGLLCKYRTVYLALFCSYKNIGINKRKFGTIKGMN